jgi:hypothetical protein
MHFFLIWKSSSYPGLYGIWDICALKFGCRLLIFFITDKVREEETRPHLKLRAINIINNDKL